MNAHLKLFLLLTVFFSLPIALFCQQEVEPNDSPEEASSINSGTINGSINTSKDLDYFAIEVTQLGIITFTLSPSDETRPVMRLFAPNQDHSPLEEETGGKGEDLVLDAIVCTPGTYILEVSDFWTSFSSDSFPYSIEIVFNDTDIYECNNSFEMAASINIGDIIQAHLLDEEDVDYYAISVVDTGVVTFTLSPPVAFRPQMRLFEPNNGITAIEEEVGNYGEDLILDKIICNPGIYILEVARFFELGIPTPELYTLEIQFDNNDIYECNNISADAAMINIGETIYAHLLDEEDFDYFAIPVADTGVITFILNPPAAFRPQMRLFAPNDNILPIEDKVAGAVGDNLTLDKLICTAGIYILEVSRFFGAGSPTPEFYSIEVQFDNSDVYECNNNSATAAAIKLNETIVAHFLDEGDLDYYSFKLSTAQKVSFSLIPPSGIRPIVKLFTPGNEFSPIIDKAGAINQELQFEVDLASLTTYIIRLSEFNGYSSSEHYQMRISSEREDEEQEKYQLLIEHRYQLNKDDNINIVDDVFLLGSCEIDQINNTINCSKDAFEICTDGSEVSLFRIKELSGKDISSFSLRILDENIPVTGEKRYGRFELVKNMSNSSELVFRYKHPLFFYSQCDKNIFLDIEVFDSVNKKSVVVSPLKFWRTPLIMLHGWLLKSEYFKKVENALRASEKMYDQDFIRRPNFFVENTTFTSEYSSIEENSFLLLNEIFSLLLSLRTENKVAAGKVDIFAHSIGGLVARYYTSSDFYKDNVHKLITCNTPHEGTQWANFVLSPNSPSNDKEDLCDQLDYEFRTDYFKSFFKDYCQNRIMEDLRTNSSFIERLNSIPNRVPIHTIGTSVTLFEPIRDFEDGVLVLGEFLGKRLLSLVKIVFGEIDDIGFYDFVKKDVFGDKDHDFFVSLRSQTGGIDDGDNSPSWTTKLYGDHWDMLDIDEDSDIIIQEIVSLLCDDVTGINFTIDGFMPSSNNPPTGFPIIQWGSNSTKSSIHLTSPEINSEFTWGDTIKIAIATDQTLSDKKIFVQELSNEFIDFDLETSQTNIKVSANMLGVGQKTIIATGTDINTASYSIDTLSIFINPDTTLDSIIISPKYINLIKGRQYLINVDGFYNGDKFNLSTMDSLDFLFKQGGVVSNSRTLLTGNTLGEDSLYISFKEIKSNSMFIKVTDPPINELINASSNPHSPDESNFVSFDFGFQPNPTKNFLWGKLIRPHINLDVKIEIFNSVGKLILQKKERVLHGKLFYITNLQDYPNSAYFIRITNASNVLSSYIVIKH